MPKQPKSITEYHHYDLPLTFPVLFQSEQKWNSSDVESKSHFHNCMQFGICLAGNGMIQTEDYSTTFEAGDICCIPRNLPHHLCTSCEDDVIWNYIYLDPEELFHNALSESSAAVSDLCMEDILGFQPVYSQKSHPRISFLLSSVIEELVNKPTNYALTVQSLLLALCLECRRHQPLPAAKPSVSPLDTGKAVITPALDYIHKNYALDFSIKELADMCHISETHFRRSFQAITGTSPLEFLNNTRIYHACILLKNTEESILYISEAVGFNSVSTFNRCFSKSMGSAPREWRKNILFEEREYK